MPSQIVVLPDHVLRRIAHQSDLDRNLGLHDMGRIVEANPALPLTVRITADPQIHCPEAWSCLRGDAFVLLLSAVQPGLTGFRPVPLQEATVLGILGIVRDAVCDLKGLSAHEKMAVARAFHLAETATVPLPSSRRGTALNPAPSTVVESARRIQTEFERHISLVDSKLASYRAIVSRRGLDYLATRLACHVELGEALHLRPHPRYPGETVPYLLATPRRGHLVAQRMACENLANSFDNVVGHLGSHIAVDPAAIDVKFIKALHRDIMRGLPGRDRGGRWRGRPAQIRSPLTGDISETQVPYMKIAGAMARLEAAYLLDDWADVHPLVRAAMVHVELARIHPFADGNGRTGRMLLQAMLIRAGCPMLPWEAVIAQDRPDYLAAIDRAIGSNDPRVMVDYLLQACEKAIKLGYRMACVMKRERETLIEALGQEGDVYPRSAQYLADWLLVHALAPEVSSSHHPALAVLNPDNIGKTEFVDEVWYQGGRCWSLPAVRKLLQGVSVA